MRKITSNTPDKKVNPEPSTLGAALSLMSSGQGWSGQRRENNVHPTKEERDQWRERLLSPFTCFDAEHATFTIRLLNALNQTEEEIARLKQEAFFWREETKDVRELFTRQLGYKEVEIARLERELYWLAIIAFDGTAGLYDSPERLVEAAREAVEEGEESCPKN